MLLAPSKSLDLSTPGLKIIGDGNSITAGQSHITELGLREPFASSGTTILNFGVAGQKTYQMLADFETQILPNITASPPTILIVLEFGNSLSTLDTVPLAFNHFENYCARARRAGAYVVACTAHPRVAKNGSGPEYSAGLNLANQMLRNNWRRFADQMFDCRTIPLFAKVRRSWCPDDVHPNRYGDIVFTDGLMPVLQRIPVRPVA